MVTKGEIVGEGGKNQELGMKTHTLLYTRYRGNPHLKTTRGKQKHANDIPE